MSRGFIPSLDTDSLANDAKKRAYWEKECLCVVRKRTNLQRSEEELSMAKRGLTLENERARAENEYRQLINLPGRIRELFASRKRRHSCQSSYRT